MVESVGLTDAFTMTTQATAPLPEPPTARRLTRSTDDRAIAGVAAGLGRYFNIDPVVVRLAFIVGIFLGGVGLIAYVAAWILVPEDKAAAGEGFDGAGAVRRLGIALGALVLTVAAAIGGFFGVAAGGATTTAIVVIAAGGLLVVGAATGGMRWLILPAIVLSLAAGIAAAADIDVRGGSGEPIYSPASTKDLRSDYRLGMGHLLLDLRKTQFDTGTHRVHLKLGLGLVEVVVPDNVCVSSTAHISGGATTVFDRSTGGTDHDWQDLHTPSAGTPHLVVDADIGFGEFRVEHLSGGGRGPAGEACND